MAQAGWSTERSINPNHLLEWYAAHGYTLWTEALSFLTSFGMLQLDAGVYSEQHIPAEALCPTEIVHPIRLRKGLQNATTLALHLDPQRIPDLAGAMAAWDISRLVQARDTAIPIGVCQTPASSYPRPLFLHRHYGILIEHLWHERAYPFSLFKSYGETISAMLTTILQQFLIYEWTEDSWPYQSIS
ncbi:SUKH-3 domain-containing protein [Herpetosiphon llansteffanensis]